MRQWTLSALILSTVHVYKWENAYSKDLYIFIKVKGGGGVLVHVYEWEHRVSLN